jgi:hypothetical protein
MDAKSKVKSSEPKLNVRTHLAKDFAQCAKDLKLSQSDLLSKVWEAYLNSEKQGKPIPTVELSGEEQGLVNQALEVSGLSFEALLKDSLLKGVGEILQAGIQIPDPPQDLSAAERRIWSKINEILHWNSYCKPDDRVYISITLFRRYHTADYGKTQKIMEMRKEELDRHHQRFNLQEDTNRKGSDSAGKRINAAELIGSYPPPQSATSRVLEEVQLQTQAQHEETLESEPEVEPTIQVAGLLSPKDYFELLKDEVNPSAHQKTSRKLLEGLRSQLGVQVSVNNRGELSNEGQGSPVELDKALEKYRRFFRSHPLTPATTSYRQLKNPRLPSSYQGGNPPAGSRLNEDGLVIAEPRHLAISYLVLSDIENAFMNLSRGEQYAEQYPQYSLAQD